MVTLKKWSDVKINYSEFIPQCPICGKEMEKDTMVKNGDCVCCSWECLEKDMAIIIEF